MHLAFFFQYYHTPDCAATGRHFTFLNRWASQHEITLITSDAWRRRRLSDEFAWVPSNVRLLEYAIPYDNRMGLAERGFAFGKYVAQSLWSGLRMPRPDVIFATSTPLSVPWAAAQVARWHDVPWVFEVRDLWPDFPIQMGALKSPWLQRRLRKMERNLYASAAHLVPLSPDMHAHIRGFNVPDERITMTYNGTNFDLIDTPIPPTPTTNETIAHLGNQFVCIYTGTFGRANAIPLLMEVSQRAASDANIHFLFIGDGYLSEDLRAFASQRPNVTVLPPQPLHQMYHFLRRADLALIPFIDRPVLRTNSPAKFYDSLSVGTAVIVTNPGWTRDFVDQHDCGWYVPPENADALYNRIVALSRDPTLVERSGQHGEAIARVAFNRDDIADRLLNIFEDLAQE